MTSPASTYKTVTGHARRHTAILLAFVVSIGLFAPPSRSADSDDLTQLSIEDLMNIEITSVSKRSERLSQTAAAAFVITAEDIRRSGYTTIPELLRLAPGLEVSRIDLNTWAITARGFNGQYASKLLVLIDGRSVYSPLFSGVFWDQQDVLIEDIERIEIIRGPGATMWGANAVNGVINIITKHSNQTQGLLVSAQAGDGRHYGSSLRYGGTVGARSQLRVYGKAYNRIQEADRTSFGERDRWTSGRGGLRLDTQVDSKSTLALSADISSSRTGYAASVPLLTPPYQAVRVEDRDDIGAYLLGRYERTFSPRSQATFQVFYDRHSQDGLQIVDNASMLDADLQHR